MVLSFSAALTAACDRVPRLSWLKNGTLQITSVTQEDDGVYTCDVTNRHGRDNVTYDVIVISECGATH